MASPLALITGGAGFIGTHLAGCLLERGYRVRVLDNLLPQIHGPGAGFPRCLDSRVETCFGDVRDSAALRFCLRDVDVVFHLAALTGVGQSMYQVHDYIETNIGGTANLLQCLIDLGQPLRRLVLASSRAVYGEGKYACAACGWVYPPSRANAQLDAHQWELSCPRCGGRIESVPTDESAPTQPGSVYAITKRAQEDLILGIGRAYGWPVTALRYFNVYGSGQSPSNPYTGLLITFLTRLFAGKALELYEDGLMRRDFVHVRDVAEATALAAERDEAIGQVINVGSGSAVTVAQVALALREAAGIVGSIREARVSRAGDVRHAVGDLQRAKALLGYAPRVPLRAGLAELVAWYERQEGNEDRTLEARKELELHQLLH